MYETLEAARDKQNPAPRNKYPGKTFYLYAISSITVFPTQTAPPSTRAETTGDVCVSASCVFAHSRLPKLVI